MVLFEFMGGQNLLHFVQANYVQGDFINYRIINQNTVEIIN